MKGYGWHNHGVMALRNLFLLMFDKDIEDFFVVFEIMSCDFSAENGVFVSVLIRWKKVDVWFIIGFVGVIRNQNV